ncbi:hypothetical protein VP01_1655g1 [Puccinia sorghi]|uniref:Uncharacterized protein n=1 Tax=Puccinia sorghi TaxID=27349 RepID=A0A0L6VGF5_9BASI|nr:hypothetical protein VP01_1655g1 [Puccinia sorghi]
MGWHPYNSGIYTMGTLQHILISHWEPKSNIIPFIYLGHPGNPVMKTKKNKCFQKHGSNFDQFFPAKPCPKPSQSFSKGHVNQNFSTETHIKKNKSRKAVVIFQVKARFSHVWAIDFIQHVTAGIQTFFFFELFIVRRRWEGNYFSIAEIIGVLKCAIIFSGILLNHFRISIDFFFSREFIVLSKGKTIKCNLASFGSAVHHQSDVLAVTHAFTSGFILIASLLRSLNYGFITMNRPATSECELHDSCGLLGRLALSRTSCMFWCMKASKDRFVSPLSTVATTTCEEFLKAAWVVVDEVVSLSTQVPLVIVCGLVTDLARRGCMISSGSCVKGLQWIVLLVCIKRFLVWGQHSLAQHVQIGCYFGRSGDTHSDGSNTSTFNKIIDLISKNKTRLKQKRKRNTQEKLRNGIELGLWKILTKQSDSETDEIERRRECGVTLNKHDGRNVEFSTF